MRQVPTGQPEGQHQLTRKDPDNRDRIHQVNYPKQSYGVSGGQCGSSKPAVRGKRPTDSAPIIISAQPPGSFALDDESWVQTYGASYDAFLNLLRGSDLQISIDAANNNFAGIFQATPTAANLNLYDRAASQQQIHYVISRNTVTAARAGAQFGDTAEVRSIGLRAPAHMVGWGHTITMRPTDPNPSDQRANDAEHKLARETWKTGPLDIRWDTKRGVWRAWNDLIADTYSNGVGTWVFATNPDATLGYPFLRGRLGDVWWVRKTNHNAATGRDNDDDQTGEICTHLQHKLFDQGGGGAAPLSDVFIINRGNDTVICGAEFTKVSTSPTLDIRTSANFQFSLALVGPIAFNSMGPFDISSSPVNATTLDIDDIYVGDMLMGSDGKWHPVMHVPPRQTPLFLCDDAGYTLHMATLFENSENIINDGVFELQDLICSWNEEYTACIANHIEWAAKNAYNAVWRLNYSSAPWLKRELQPVVNSIMTSTNAALAALTSSVNALIINLVGQIEACTECEIIIPQIAPPTLSTIPINPDQMGCPGETPPECTIDSFAQYQIDTGAELNIHIENPCGPDDTLVASCAFTHAGTSEGEGVLGDTTFFDPTAPSPPLGHS